MAKYVYVLENSGTIYRYSIQSDGTLSSLGNSVQCARAAYMAYTNASQFPGGDDFLFLVGSGGTVGEATEISVYHVDANGNLTMKVDHYSNGASAGSAADVAALWWGGSSDYFIYVTNAGFTESDISAYGFSPSASPNAITDLGDPASNFSTTNNLYALEVVAAPGAGVPPSSPVPYIYALYGTPGPTEIVSFGTSASGGINFISAVLSNSDKPIVLAGTPNGDFAYVCDTAITGVQANAGQLTSLGTVGQLAESGTAEVVSPDGKYLFVSVYGVPFSIMSYKIGSDGSLTPAPAGSVPSGGQVFALAVEPGGQYLYAPSSDGFIYIYEINQTNGNLTPKTPVQRSSGGQVFSMAILEV
ncbi:hypothetical protein GCM10011491_09310 [Brucella endophytica]|uniref:Lactonase family protein n=1 Tax=Brucella endophytica TaxID=1963359 RepID=A0A916WBF3_9HYPH|nr:beta-propeller fold lactonase family protein [Brucella endophytica]GGA83991.1 hypothetical protein GCM10011491_09310 [Brucella endophytica]